MNLFVGRVEQVREAPLGREGTVWVRGARVDVLLDAVPEARVGDSVLVHAGVALSILRDQHGADPETAFPVDSRLLTVDFD